VIVFGLMMVIVLQRARDGLWPLLPRLVPVRAAPQAHRPAAALPRRTLPGGELILEAAT
jgi:branched-chain amino acid transport system permease protein